MSGQDAEEALPDEVGPYRILERLGRGGMGVVYRGRHRESGEEAAVKTVSVPHEGLLQSLRREIHALARIRHPGVVRIVDEGVEDGLPWYAMELLEGRTLRQYCKELGTEAGAELPETRAEAAEIVPETAQQTEGERGRAMGVLPAEPPAELRAGGPGTAGPVAEVRQSAAGGALLPVLTLVRRLCAPLAFLHGEGIVHRDLKPANVLVLPGDRPVLVDFGLASRFTGEVSREVLEVEGGVVGTYLYMAPEQGRGELVDARADLYALGCILYELVTGRKPFLGTSPMHILLQHMEAAPPAPSQLVDGVPPELEELILRLLAKEPRERLGHADDVAAVLARLGAGNGSGNGVRPRSYLYRPGLAGRGEVLRALGRLLGEMAAAGQGGSTHGSRASGAEAQGQGRPGAGGLILIGGESGVGKTRLATEVASAVRRRGGQVLVGECYAAGSAETGKSGPGAPLHALSRPLRAIADRCREGGVAETQRLLGERGQLLSLYEPALQGLPGLVETQDVASLPAEAARRRIFSFLAVTLAALAGEGAEAGPGGQQMPLLLVLDDLQWADDLTLGFMEFVLHSGHLERMRLAILGTYRTDEAGPGLQRLLEAPRCKRVELERLGEAGVGEMVCDMLAIQPAPAVFVRFLARHTEGNPFFVAEYLRTAIAEGLLYRDEKGRWQVAEVEAQHAAPEAAGSVYDALPLPRSVRELVARRLDGLSAAAQALAEAASVCIGELDEAALAGIVGSGGLESLEAVRELVARQVLRETKAGRLRFVHAKIREVAYDRIPAERRRGLHHRAAEAIEGRPAVEPSGAEASLEDLAALGHHWEQAQVPDKARRSYLAGARKAVSSYANEAAERAYRAYLRLVDVPTPESIAARDELAKETLMMQGRCAEALELHLQSLEEARQLKDRRAEGRSLQRLGIVYYDTGRLEEARQHYEQALAAHRETGDRAFEGRTLSNLALAYAEQGRNETALALYEQALEIHRQVGNRLSEGIVFGQLALLHADQGRLQVARELYERALAVHRELGNREFEGIELGNLALTFGDEGRWDEARRLYEQALAIHREIGARRFEGIVLSNLAIAEAEEGRPEAALALGRQALAIHREVGNSKFEGISLSYLGKLHAGQGHLDEARQLFRESLAILRQVGDEQNEGVTLGFAAKLERRAGETAAAERLLDQAETLLRRVADPINLALCLCERGQIALLQSRPAQDFLEQAQQAATRLGTGPRSDLGQAVASLRQAMIAAGQLVSAEGGCEP